MPEPAAAPRADPVEGRARSADARLVRGVRWRLLAWSAGTTFVVLLLLGSALYVAVARSLERADVQLLESRAAEYLGARDPRRGGPEPDVALGRPLAMVLDERGRQVGQRRIADPPEGLPDPDAVRAAAGARDGRDVRTSALESIPVRILTQRVQTPIGALYVQVVGDRTAEQRTLNVMLVVLALGGLLAMLVATGVGGVYAERALVPIRESLARQRGALRRQREFAADASHELRTPLTVIRSSVDHLRRHPGVPVADLADAVDDIDAEVQHLTSLVDDLLLLARSDSGALTLEPHPVDLGEVAAEAASSLAATAERKGVRLAIEAEPVVVMGDAGHLRRLVRILVDNAIRHTPPAAGVRVRAERSDAGGALVVSDDGPGIRPEDLPRVFERFWRASGAPAGGTGLGLAIAASIAHLHGGTITVASAPGAGATFTVRLPEHPAPAAADAGPLRTAPTAADSRR